MNKATAYMSGQRSETFFLFLLFAGCWLEVSTRPEGPATGHLDTGFRWFSSVFK